MNTNAQIGYGTWEDLIFRHRNKNYGAYLLRKEHDKHMIYGFLISILPLILLFFFSLKKSEAIIPFEKPKIIIELVKPDIIPIEIIQPATKTKGEDVIPDNPSKPKLPEELKPIVPITETIVEKSEVQDDKKTDEVIDPNQGFGNDKSENNEASLSNGNTGGIGIGTGKNDGTETGKIYDFDMDDVDRPEFVGGEKAMIKYLQKSIRTPKDEFNKDSKLVKVLFVIGNNGEIEDVKIIKSAGVAYDSEAKRVVENMPNWKPGKHGGKPARFRMILPIRFVGRY